MLLAGGFLLFTLVYIVYSATSLGRINTLPPLPEHYKADAADEGFVRVKTRSGPSPLERKMEQAFGIGCKELKWPVLLELNAKSMVMAAGMFEVVADGRMKLEPMSVALFGKRKNDGRDIEINTLKCNQAYITFDRPVASINEISGRKIVQAELIGDIVIVNNRRTVLRDDDLSVTIPTGPLYYFEPQQLIRTSDAVHLMDGQLKPPKADIRAKGMEMQLATTAPPPKPGVVPASKPKNESISGVKRIVLKQDVTMHLYTAGQTPFPNSDKSRPEPTAPQGGTTPQRGTVTKPPQEISHIVIRTPGRFQYDLFKDHDQARFDVPEEVGQPSTPQDVTVERINDGTEMRDQLVCKHLELRLKRRDNEAQTASKAAAQTAEQNLEIETAHATGPDVTLASDAEKLDAHGNDFFHDASKKLTILKGVPYMEANKDDSLMQAPEMQIQDIPLLTPPGSPPKTYQQVTAKGPGSIHLPKKVGDKIVHTTHASWNEKLTSTRDGSLDLLILTGSASFVDEEQEQSLKAETLKVWLLTQEHPPPQTAVKSQPAKPPTAKTPEPKMGAETSRRPHHVEALRNVLAHSRDLNIHDASRLVVRFTDVPESRMPPPSGGKPGARPPENKASAAPPPIASRGPAAATTPAVGKPAAAPVLAPTGPPANSTAKPVPEPARPIDLTARSVEAEVLRCGERNALDHLWTEGYVKVRQAPAKPGEKGIYIEGDTLDMRAQEGGNLLVVTGRDDQGNMAQLQMDKMLIFGPEVNIDQARNKAWVIGSGAMQMDSNTTLDGKPLDRTVPLTVHWSEEMFFQGANAEFTGNIQAEQENARLACQSLQVFFDRPISLKEGTRGDQPAKVRNLVGFKDVRVEDKAYEKNQLQKYQLIEGRSITMDTVPRDDAGPRQPNASKDANDVTVSGPGSVRILQRGGADMTAPPGKTASAKPAEPARAPAPGDQEMKMTYVKFENIMKASNRTNTASFWGSVRVLNFPCEDPHCEIDLDAMLATALPAGAMYLRADRLKVLSTPQTPGQKSNQEMEAHGHIVVQAKELSAQSDHMFYNEAKDQIIFVADPGNLATLAQFKGKGVQPDTLQGEKILYIRSTGRAEVLKGNSLYGN
jgi:hypothetical protein